jgi:hypothetical protein
MLWQLTASTTTLNDIASAGRRLWSVWLLDLDNHRTQDILRIARSAEKAYGLSPEIFPAARWWTFLQ